MYMNIHSIRSLFNLQFLLFYLSQLPNRLYPNALIYYVYMYMIKMIFLYYLFLIYLVDVPRLR